MKKLFALALFATCLATPALADDNGMNPHKMMIDKMFQDADTNNDGYISKDEFMAYSQKKFDEMDTNHDGKLSRDEVMAFKKHEKEMMKSSMGSPNTGGMTQSNTSNNTKTNGDQ